MKGEIDNLLSHVETLDLSAFEPKLQANPKVETGENGEPLESKPVYAVDEDRKISRRTYLAVKFFGDKL